MSEDKVKLQTRHRYMSASVPVETCFIFSDHILQLISEDMVTSSEKKLQQSDDQTGWRHTDSREEKQSKYLVKLHKTCRF